MLFERLAVSFSESKNARREDAIAMSLAGSESRWILDSFFEETADLLAPVERCLADVRYPRLTRLRDPIFWGVVRT